jgi:hypothetical protein
MCKKHLTYVKQRPVSNCRMCRFLEVSLRAVVPRVMYCVVLRGPLFWGKKEAENVLRIDYRVVWRKRLQVRYGENFMVRSLSCILYIYIYWVHLCGLVVRVPDYRSRGPGSISGATRFSEKKWVWIGVHSASWVQLRSCLIEKVAAPV